MTPDSNVVGNKEIPDYSIAHLFADYGVECEVLGRLGTVSRYTIDPNQSEFDDDTIGTPYVLILFGSFLMGTAITPIMEPAYSLILGVLLLAGGVSASMWDR